MQARTQSGTKRYNKRRADIVDVASRHINRHGVRGMTLTAIARDLRIDTSSLLYYFRNKEDLAVACLGRSLDWQREAATAAALEPNIEAVIRSLLHAFLELHRRTATAPQMAVLSDMHSLAGDSRRILFDAYGETIRVLLTRFQEGGIDPADAPVITSVLLASIHWLSAWIHLYPDSDFARVEERLYDLLMNGIGTCDPWPPGAVPTLDPGGEDAQSRFLLAATNLLNRDGYHGASVEKIAAELGVSTGSFYHHLDNKDDLVVACFERSHRLQLQALQAGEDRGENKGQQLAVALTALVELQIDGDSPILRSGTYQALPQELRAAMLALAQQDTLHVAGLVADGIAQGTIRAVDPMIAGHFFLSIVTAAGDLRRWDGLALPADAAARLSSMFQDGTCGQRTVF